MRFLRSARYLDSFKPILDATSLKILDARIGQLAPENDFLK